MLVQHDHVKGVISKNERIKVKLSNTRTTEPIKLQAQFAQRNHTLPIPKGGARGLRL